MMGCMWCLHHEVCLVVFLPHRTGWFRRFLVANACLLGQAEHAGRPTVAHAGLPYPRFYNGVMTARCPRKLPMCTASPHVKGSIRRGRTGCTRA